MTQYTRMVEEVKRLEQTQQEGWTCTYEGTNDRRSFYFKNGVVIVIDKTGSNELDNISIPDKIRSDYGSKKEIYAKALERYRFEKKQIQKQRASNLG